MSFVDGFRPMAASLFDTMASPATITRTTKGAHDRIKGTFAPSTTEVRNCRAALGRRKLTADDGTIRVQSVARLNAEAQAGDVLKIGLREFTLGDVEEVNPDGTVPFLWIAVLR